MTVNIEATVTRTLPSSGGVTTVEVRLDPVAKTKPTTRHVTLLVDTSVSMGGEKLQNAKEGARRALKELDDGDYVGVVGFDSEVETIHQMARWGETDQGAAERAVAEIESGGGTDIYKGLEAARDQLMEDAPDAPGAVKRIVLLSDGQDRYDPSTYRDLAADFDDDGISIIAAGIGFAYDEAVMVALANASGGAAADLSEEEIDQFLEDTVSDTENVIASNPRLEIEPARGFIVNDEPACFDAPSPGKRAIDSTGSPATVGLPELEVSNPHRLTFEMLGQPKPTGLTYDLADVRAVAANGSVLAETSVEIDYTDEAGIEQLDVEKARAAAKVRADIQDSEVSRDAVEASIKELEDRGWKRTADELEQDLEIADSDGGLIRVGESDIDFSENK